MLGRKRGSLFRFTVVFHLNLLGKKDNTVRWHTTRSILVGSLRRIWPYNLENYQLVSKIPFSLNEVKRASFCSLRWRYITCPWNINVSAGWGRWMEAHMPALIKRSLNPCPDLLPKEA